ncbi:MAG: hypothetical protein V7756_16060 [Halopseudomonas sp.]|uniref:hypothetical protein n=1 Tax=Halopseudomonas sp. TaxID=2901191 RepID=UPI003002C0C7
MTSMKKLALAASVSATLFVSGCASIVSDSQYPVVVKSEPPGAEYQIRNRSGSVIHQGTTPSTVTLKAGDGYFRGARYNLQFTKDGYEQQSQTLDSSMDGWYWGNVLIGGAIGLLLVDPVTGAMYKLPPARTANLVQVPMAPPAQPDAAEVVSAVEVDAASK